MEAHSKEEEIMENKLIGQSKALTRIQYKKFLNNKKSRYVKSQLINVKQLDFYVKFQIQF